jgi:hypothetical protein
MDPSPIEDPAICGGGEGFHEDNKSKTKKGYSESVFLPIFL